jgi:O-antigen/teichoic acid export membrane protein
MSSSDRIILEQILGTTSVGIYSLAYNIALVLMLVNSGIALALPTYMIKNFKNWKNEKYDNKLIKYYTTISIILFFVVFSLYYMDLKYFHILGYYGDEMPILILIIYLSIYILGLYYFYANYLFYYKKAAIISKVTFKAALLNILLTTILIYFIGVIGAAVATFIAYVYYLILIKNEVLKIDKGIDIDLFKIVTLCFIVCLGIFIFFRSIF